MSERAPASPPLASHQMRVLPGGWQARVPAHLSLLQAALAAGIQMPSSCRNGSCRACIAKLVSGQIAYRIEWPGLLAEEKTEGWILPCVALARSDLVIEAAQATRLSV